MASHLGRGRQADLGAADTLLSVASAAETLNCSKEHVMKLVDDGDLQYVDIARKGSKHREIRFTQEQIERFKKDRTRQNAARSTSTGSFAARMRAKYGM
jgi:excisionase family DNA binding protein